jgi:ABC-type branched-subunit amino acid transport system substrate-binding protein
MVYDEKVHYVVGPIGNNEAVIPIFHENKCFCTGGTSVWMGGPELPYYIQGIVDITRWTEVFYEQVAEHHPEFVKLAVLNTDSATGIGYLDRSVAAAEKVGLETIEGTYAQFTTDFYPLLTRILSQEPDVIEASASAGDGALIAKQARELGYTGWFLHINWVPLGLMIDNMGVDEMYNIVTTLPDFTSEFYSPAMNDLVRRYMEEKAKPDETDMPDTVVHGYSHMMFYVEAIKQAQSIDPDDVMKVFDDPSFRFERYYHSDGQLSGLETFGILRQMSHFNPYGEIVIENGEPKVVQMGGKVAVVP